MGIVPAGKTRVMVAQNFSNPLSEGFGGNSAADENISKSSIDPGITPEQGTVPETGILETGRAMEEDINEEANPTINDDVSIEPGEDQEVAPKENGKKTLTTYIYEKLQNYGYPGRRLQDFKAEFVRESISPEGVKDIQVVIPDKKYPDAKGYTDTIENEELKQISHEVNQMFGLNFNGAERSDGKWTIKFTSADLSDPEEEISNDNLDQVYGKPEKSQSDKQRTMRSAAGTGEMTKYQKSEIVNKLKEIGDK